jgi:hypothetical protein
MRFVSTLGVAALLSFSTGVVSARAEDSALIQKKLLAEYSLTKTAADRSDIVTAGAVLVLHKDGLVMYSTSTASPPLNIYKDGRFQHNDFKDKWKVGFNRLKPGNTDTTDINSIPQRKFVDGEKFWVTAITMQPDGAVFDVYSDPYNDVRYYGQVKFPYPKNSPPAVDDMVKTVEEVITVQPSDDDKTQKADAGARDNGAKKDVAPTQSASAPAKPMQDIAPPPPPPDQAAAPPKTISLGQTKEVVVATWGQPTKMVKLSSKEIYYYPDIKVTFVAGKVSDIQ